MYEDIIDDRAAKRPINRGVGVVNNHGTAAMHALPLCFGAQTAHIKSKLVTYLVAQNSSQLLKTAVNYALLD